MKKITILLISVVFISCIGLFLLLKYGSIVRFTNENASLETNNLSIEKIINKSIKIQYKNGNKKELSKIYTSDFIKQIDSDPDYFYKKHWFYTIDNNYMNSFRILNTNQATVSVRVEDSSGSYIQEITLTKDSSGTYKILDIEYDL